MLCTRYRRNNVVAVPPITSNNYSKSECLQYTMFGNVQLRRGRLSFPEPRFIPRSKLIQTQLDYEQSLWIMRHKVSQKMSPKVPIIIIILHALRRVMSTHFYWASPLNYCLPWHVHAHSTQYTLQGTISHQIMQIIDWKLAKPNQVSTTPLWHHNSIMIIHSCPLNQCGVLRPLVCTRVLQCSGHFLTEM